MFPAVETLELGALSLWMDAGYESTFLVVETQLGLGRREHTGLHRRVGTVPPGWLLFGKCAENTIFGRYVSAAKISVHPYLKHLWVKGPYS